MCQTLAQGGRRCAAHNNSAEHKRCVREASAAKRAYAAGDAEYADKLANGTATPDDLAHVQELQQWYEVADLRARLADPKTSQETLDMVQYGVPPEVRVATMPIAESVVKHQKAAAKSAGEASRCRSLARAARKSDDESAAAAFEEQGVPYDEDADLERSKAERMASVLRGALVEFGTLATEGVTDRSRSVGSVLATPLKGTANLLKDVVVETGQSLREGVAEAGQALDDALVETVEAVGEGVGVTPWSATSPVAGQAEPTNMSEDTALNAESDAKSQDTACAPEDDPWTVPTADLSIDPVDERTKTERDEERAQRPVERRAPIASAKPKTKGTTSAPPEVQERADQFLDHWNTKTDKAVADALERHPNDPKEAQKAVTVAMLNLNRELENLTEKASPHLQSVTDLILESWRRAYQDWQLERERAEAERAERELEEAS